MKIVSDVEIIDGNPWWCKDYGTLNHSQPIDKETIPWWEPSHVCYPKGQIISKCLFDFINFPKSQCQI